MKMGYLCAEAKGRITSAVAHIAKGCNMQVLSPKPVAEACRRSLCLCVHINEACLCFCRSLSMSLSLCLSMSLCYVFVLMSLWYAFLVCVCENKTQVIDKFVRE